MFATFQSYLDPWFLFLAEDPMLRALQLAMLGAGSLAIFLVFFVTRDILLRTDSFVYMFFCILLAALLPGIGFLLYLLIRPPRTMKERETEVMLRELLGKKPSTKPQQKTPEKPPKQIAKAKKD